jgi:hypothetical protein
MGGSPGQWFGQAPQGPGQVPAGPSAAPSGTAERRARRPFSGAAIAAAAIVAAIPVARLLLHSVISTPVSATGVISSVLVLLGLPLAVVGLHGLARGTTSDAPAPQSWLRPPVAYLTVALVLFVAAGLAAR